MTYEFVPKSEYSAVRIDVEKIINSVQHRISQSYKFSFRFELTGSGSRKLVTREAGGNKGFDLDYNLIVQSRVKNEYKAKELKDIFMNAFREAIKGTVFSGPEDSTSVLTIKYKDIENSRIEYGCDFAIMCDDEGVRYFIKHHKENGGYGYEKRCDLDELDEYLENIKHECGSEWNQSILDKYLVLKNRNKDCKKHSYSLYIETVKNLSNEIDQ